MKPVYRYDYELRAWVWVRGAIIRIVGIDGKEEFVEIGQCGYAAVLT